MFFQEKGVLTVEFNRAGLPHLLGWLGVVLNELSLLVEHLYEDAVASSIGRNKLEQKLPLGIIPLDILIIFIPLGDPLLKIAILHPDLHTPILTLHLRY